MDKNYKYDVLLYIFLIILISVFSSSCEKKDTPPQDNNPGGVVQNAQSITVSPGYQRAKLTWETGDPNIKKAVVYQEADSVNAVLSGSSKMEAEFKNIKGGNQTFYIYQYDSDNNRSSGAKVVAYIYDDENLQSLEGRPIKTILYADGDLEITWETAPENSFNTMLEYTDNTGTQNSLVIKKEENNTVLNDYEIGSNFKYNTQHLPDEALDTLISPDTEISSLDFSDMTVKWDESSIATLAVFGGYCRIIQLSDGNLVGIYEIFGEIQFVKSTDKGKNWSNPVTVIGKNDDYNMTTPSVIELNNGSLLAAYGTRPLDGEDPNPDPSTPYTVNIIGSMDGGNSWVSNQVLFEAGPKFKEGCWEPDMVQMPDGEIQLFFSNEKPFGNTDEQEIVLLRSNDNGVSWTNSPEITSFDPGYRDGMPVPLVLPESNQIIYSIENNRVGDFKPYIIRNTIQENWQTTVGANDSRREYALSSSLPNNVYAGAPYITQFRNMVTLLSFQSTENRSSQWDLSSMNVAVGDKEGRNFKNVTVPFNIANDKSGLWNSLCVLDDGTIIAVTSTNAYHESGWGEVKTIEGKFEFLFTVQ